MSSIKLVVVASDRPQADGRKVIYRITLTDDLGDDHTIKIGPKNVPTDFDAEADAIAIATARLAGMADEEAQQAEGAIEDGDALDRVLNSRWGAEKKIAKRLILLIMRERDPRLVVLLEPLIQYLRDNYTANQLANWLGITVQQVLAMNRRINAVLSSTGTIKAQLAVFDGERVEWEE